MSSVLSSSGMSLESIGLTLGLGLGVSFITIIAFGIAVMKRNTNIAPRCTARHPNTIWRRRKDIVFTALKLQNHAKSPKEDSLWLSLPEFLKGSEKLLSKVS